MGNCVTAIILAAGSGTRMNNDIPKQHILLHGESILRRAVLAFEGCEDVDSIIVVARAGELETVNSELCDIKKLLKVIPGGKTRAESAALGFSEICNECEYVAIHDAARCFVTSDMISAVISDAKKHGAATASSLVTDTVKFVGENGHIVNTVDRSKLRTVQTPQVFSSDLYRKALDASDPSDSAITDDNVLMERIGVDVFCTDTGKANFKITTSEDLNYA